jgi:hypothetical protein
VGAGIIYPIYRGASCKGSLIRCPQRGYPIESAIEAFDEGTYEQA